MIRLDLQQFGGRGGSSGSGNKQSQSKSKQELPEEIRKRITDSNGNVKEIVNGFRYVIDYLNGTKDRFSASEARELLEGFSYDKDTGNFRSEINRNRQYKVTLVKSAAKSSSKSNNKAQASTGKTRMMTALVRDKNGNLRTMRYDDYSSQRSYKSELQGNGYKVLKIWNGNKKDDEVDKWEFLNRKGTRTRSGSRSKKK